MHSQPVEGQALWRACTAQQKSVELGTCPSAALSHVTRGYEACPSDAPFLYISYISLPQWLGGTSGIHSFIRYLQAPPWC